MSNSKTAHPCTSARQTQTVMTSMTWQTRRREAVLLPQKPLPPPHLPLPKQYPQHRKHRPQQAVRHRKAPQGKCPHPPKQHPRRKLLLHRAALHQKAHRQMSPLLLKRRLHPKAHPRCAATESAKREKSYKEPHQRKDRNRRTRRLAMSAKWTAHVRTKTHLHPSAKTASAKPERRGDSRRGSAHQIV